MYRDCALKLCSEDILKQPANPSFELQFDYCDQVSDDPLELIYNCQFCCEKWAIPLFSNGV